MSAERDKAGRPLALYVSFPAENGDGRSLWPERYPDDALARAHAVVGSRIYRKEFRCLIEDENAAFRPDWIRNFLAPDFKRERALVRAACDPSAGSAERNDFKAIIVLARPIPQSGIRNPQSTYCLHAWIRHASPLELIDRLIWVWDTCQPGRFACEANGFQAFIWPLLELDEQLRGRVERAGLFPVTNTASKADRILRRSPEFEQGLCCFDPAEGDQKLLIDQFLDYGKPGVHDDGPDAWDMADNLFPKHLAGSARRVHIAQRETDYVGMLA